MFVAPAGRTPSTPPASPATPIDVGAVGAVDGDGVGRAVAAAVRRRAGRCRPRVTSVPLRSPTTMLSAPPSARKSMRSTSFRSIVTLAMSRKKQRAPAVGDDVDVLVDVRAEEQQRVGAVLAFDGVVAVARIPLEHVVAGAEQRDVVAVVAERRSRCRRRRSACRRPGCRGSCRCRRRRRCVSLIDAGRQRRGGDRVVAAEAVDDERVVRAFGVR